MAWLLDTNVAIHLRDGDGRVDHLIDGLVPPLMISIITRVELEGDLGRPDAHGDVRLARLNALLDVTPVLPFGAGEADAYRRIITVCGYSRRKVLDRMIAAQAIVAGATLVTLNGPDFRDIPGLSLLEW